MDLHRRLTPEGDYRRVRSRSVGATTVSTPAPVDQRPGRRRLVPQENANGIKAAMGWERAPSGIAPRDPAPSRAEAVPAPLPSSLPPAGRPSGVETPRIARRRTSATATNIATPAQVPTPVGTDRRDQAAAPLTPSRIANPLAYLYPTEQAQNPAPVTKETDGVSKTRSRSVPSLSRGSRPNGLADITNGPRADPIAEGPTTPRAGTRRGSLTHSVQPARKTEEPYTTSQQTYGQPSPRAYTNGWAKSRSGTIDDRGTEANSTASTRGGEPSPVLPDLRRRRVSATSVTAGKPSARGDRQPSPTATKRERVELHQPLTGPYMHSWQIPKNPITHSSWYLAPENPVPLHAPAKVTPPIGHPERYDRIPPDEYPSTRFPTSEPLFCKYSPFDLVMPLD